MELRTQRLVFLILLTIFIYSESVDSRNLAISPSPESGVFIPRMKGSLPVACHAKCNQCKPCIPIEVSIQAIEVQENEYYPLVWKCICQKTIFSP
ncbi:hypothetical protein SLE2022_156530 [Rubroshorea leprosula]